MFTFVDDARAVPITSMIAALLLTLGGACIAFRRLPPWLAGTFCLFLFGTAGGAGFS
jgi:hypothetical protein